MATDRLRRRKENRVVSCLYCGETLGIYIEGGRVPEALHVCERNLNDEGDVLAELRDARGGDDEHD